MLQKKWFRLTSVALFLALLGLMVFRDFVFGEKFLLYKDIGSDSLNSYYPDLVHLSRYLRSDGLPMWSFHTGMGQDLFQNIGALIFSPAVWFPPGSVAYLLVYQHLFYLIVAGPLFFRFLELRGLNFAASLLGALLLGFSAYFCMGSCWTICAQEILCVVFALFAIETTLQRGQWIYLPFAAALFGLLVAFYLYLGVLFILIYSLGRILAASRGPQDSVRKLAPFVVLTALGFGLVAFVWLDNLAAVFESTRGPGSGTSYAHSLLHSNPFGLGDSRFYWTQLLRPFSQDLLGLGNQFRGWRNYFEAPISYCGLLTLLMLPQAFVRQKWRPRILAALFLSAILFTSIFPWFRYLFWLFQGDYFRTLTLFAVIGAITLSAGALSNYVEKQRLNHWLLLATLGALLALLYLPVAELQQLLDQPLRNLAAFFLVIYAGVLVFGQWLNQRSRSLGLLIAVSSIELAYFSWHTVSPRPTATKQEWRDRLGYNDHTVEAVREIQAHDQSFFRITKMYPSSMAEHESLNDAFIFGYFGTSSYSSFNSLHYINFLIGTGALPPDANEIDTRWAYGLLGQPLLSSFAGEKYLLTRQPKQLISMPDYAPLRQHDDVHVFLNRRALPLGLFYPEAIPESLFASLTPAAKGVALFRYAIVPDESSLAHEPPTASQLNEILARTPIAEFAEQRHALALQINHFKQSAITGTIACPSRGLLILQTPFDRGWRATIDGARTETMRADVGLLGVAMSEGKHQISLQFVPQYRSLGLAISLLSLSLIFYGFRRWPRIKPLAA